LHRIFQKIQQGAKNRCALFLHSGNNFQSTDCHKPGLFSRLKTDIKCNNLNFLEISDRIANEKKETEFFGKNSVSSRKKYSSHCHLTL